VLEWLTFAAAALAAIGTVLGPVVTYRTVMATIKSDQEKSAEEQLQRDIDRYVSYALEEGPVAEMGVKQLLYLRQTGTLSDQQSNAVAEAITASLTLAQEALNRAPGATAVQSSDGDPDAVVARRPSPHQSG